MPTLPMPTLLMLTLLMLPLLTTTLLMPTLAAIAHAASDCDRNAELYDYDNLDVL